MVNQFTKKTINNKLKLNFMNYQETAQKFAEKHGIEFTTEYTKFARYWAEDKEARAIFTCTLKRKDQQYTFKFGQSIFNGTKEPELYDILACLTKYDPIDIENFCADYGYQYGTNHHENHLADSRFKKVQDEYNNVNRLFFDIMDELRQID